MWNEQTTHLKDIWVCDVSGMDFLGFGMARAFMYQAAEFSQVYNITIFLLNVYETFFKFLLGHKFGQKSANFGQFKSWHITKPMILSKFCQKLAKKSQFKPKKDPPGILALGYYFFSFFDISKNYWTKLLKNMGKISSWA